MVTFTATAEHGRGRTCSPLAQYADPMTDSPVWIIHVETFQLHSAFALFLILWTNAFILYYYKNKLSF